MIRFDTGCISTVVISTALGPGGQGIFPYTLCPPYRRLLKSVPPTGTTVLAKSATRRPRRGNFIPWNPLTWKYIQRFPNLGLLNAYGLTNSGVERCARDIKTACSQGMDVVPNFYPEFAKGEELAIRETVEALEIYQKSLGEAFWALELNFSCPNSQEAVHENVTQGLKCVQAVRAHQPRLVVIVKISLVHPYEFAQELERLGVQAIHGVNTIPYEIIFPPEQGPPSPLTQAGGGGLSGGPALAEALRYNAGLRRAVRLPLIMGCGVSKFTDVQRYLDLGADAVSLCTLALRRPKQARQILLAYNLNFSA
jgi:dihydroorotate dehydrogenase (NAD+) catalytic subunit